jgi:hypothetical protein
MDIIRKIAVFFFGGKDAIFRIEDSMFLGFGALDPSEPDWADLDRAR